MSTRVRISQPFADNDVTLQAVHHSDGFPRQNYAMSIVFEPYEDGGMHPVDGHRRVNGPPMRELIQSILDEAWDNGFRPSGYGDVKEATTAVKEHLSDMRAIAFHKLGIAS